MLLDDSNLVCLCRHEDAEAGRIGREVLHGIAMRRGEMDTPRGVRSEKTEARTTDRPPLKRKNSQNDISPV